MPFSSQVNSLSPIEKEKNAIKNVLQNSFMKDRKTQAKKQKQKQIIVPYHFFLRNEIIIQQKIKQIYQRYYVFHHYSPLKIGEFNPEQSHLENYEDLSNLITIQDKYALVTYPFSRKTYPDSKMFFSQFIDERTFFHHFFSSYFYLIDSIVLLNKNDYYPLLTEETIFFNRDKIPILDLSVTYSLSSTISINELLLFIQQLSIHHLSFLPIEFHILFLLEREKKTKWTSSLDTDFLGKDVSYFENKTKEEIANECLLSIPTLNNYQLSLLYLKQVDKITKKPFIPWRIQNAQSNFLNMPRCKHTKIYHDKCLSVQPEDHEGNSRKYEKIITTLRECFQKVIDSKSRERENWQVTREKIENLFL